MLKGKGINIDDEKCDGCGLCIPACAELDLQIVEEKANV
jgi:NAD-dependent dihydropyrimidine dehydrogenase PreA subunit